LWPIKTDFVLTTLATRKQSQIFPQHIAPETPLQHVCDFFEENTCSSHVIISIIFFAFDFVKKTKIKRIKQINKKKKHIIFYQETCFQ
jgi:ascorbate-specific PTS system EIIC-type component UlaA